MSASPTESPAESIVLIGGEGTVALTLRTLLGGWPVDFRQADFSDGDATMAAVQAASVILVAIEDDPAPALACCGILNESDSGLTAPIALVTADPVDATLRLAALRAGADDVISLEQNVTVAAARLSALLRLRALQLETGVTFEGEAARTVADLLPDQSIRVLVIADDPSDRQSLLKAMLSLTTTVATGDPGEALFAAASQKFDLVLVHGGTLLADALRVCGQLRCIPQMRFVPLMALVSPEGSLATTGDVARNIDDCLRWNGETNELILRALLHLRRRRLLEALSRASAEIAAESAPVLDDVTGLPTHEKFAAALRALRSEAVNDGIPLFMGLIRVSGLNQPDELECVSYLIRRQLEGREIASHIDEDVFAILFPNRSQAEANAAIESLHGQLEARHRHFQQRFGGKDSGLTVDARASNRSSVRTILVDAVEEAL